MFSILKIYLNRLLICLLIFINIFIINKITLPTNIVVAKENDYLILVNKHNPVSNTYIPNNLVAITSEDNIDYIERKNEIMYINNKVLEQYVLLYNDALANGITLTIFSAYRSYEKQEMLWNQRSNINYIAPPGCSEHQTGLAIDISIRTIGLTKNFMNSKEYNYLINNAYKYGFINRYPKNKEEITGYYFEPWHFRYVGYDHSLKIHNQNITLEEYLS